MEIKGFIRNARDSGQVLLITLLVLTIATTVGLSLVGRSTTDVSINTQVEDSARAFNAAEAAIEEALKTGQPVTLTVTPGVSSTVSVTPVGGQAGVYKFPQRALRGQTYTLWLVNHDDDGTLVEQSTYKEATIDACWSQEETIPAMVITVLYKESSTNSYRVVKGAYDADAGRATSNKFVTPTGTDSGCGSGTGTGFYKQTVNFSALNAEIDPAADTLIALRLKPLYSDTNLQINAPAAIPAQGKSVEAVGSTVTGVTRKIVVNQEYRTPSALFDYIIYSQSGLGHQ